MTATTLSHPVSVPAALLRLGRLIVLFIDGVMDARAMAGRYDRLRRMTKLELARLGLTRQDIPRAVVNGVAGL
jgi:serine phosphatase RsbU (regulator of sigma subunit)